MLMKTLRCSGYKVFAFQRLLQKQLNRIFLLGKDLYVHVQQRLSACKDWFVTFLASSLLALLIFMECCVHFIRPTFYWECFFYFCVVDEILHLLQVSPPKVLPVNLICLPASGVMASIRITEDTQSSSLSVTVVSVKLLAIYTS